MVNTKEIMVTFLEDNSIGLKTVKEPFNSVLIDGKKDII